MTLQILPTQHPQLGGAPWHEVVFGNGRFLVHRRQLEAITVRADVLAMAKQALAQVVIETSAYCNRTCVFCPNKDGMRLEKAYMDPAIYEQILNDLQTIDFAGSMLFHLYNEPLADDHIYEYLRLAKKKLPRASKALNTNGDYLDETTLERLAEAGLKQLNVSIYGKNPGHFDPAVVEARIQTLVNKLDLKTNASSRFDLRATKHGMRIRLFSQNFNETGYDRGGLVSVGLHRSRKSPCASPFKEILVGYDGKVLPCCNIHPSSADHAAYVVDQVTPGRGILDIFASERQAQWRRALLHYKAQTGPCALCTRQDCGEIAPEVVETYEELCKEKLGVADD